MQKRTLELTHKQIELLTSALGVAEKSFTDLYKQYIETINVRGGMLDQSKELHEIACMFADLNADIRQNKLDV